MSIHASFVLFRMLVWLCCGMTEPATYLCCLIEPRYPCLKRISKKAQKASRYAVVLLLSRY